MFNAAKRRPAERHGLSKDPAYQAWAQAIQRCHNPRHRAYPRYGGRGIKVCAAWRRSFVAFLNAVGPRPSRKHTLDRFPDRDGGYKPGNVRWFAAVRQDRDEVRREGQGPLGGTAAQPRTKLIAVRVKEDERRWIEREAKRRKTSVADLLRLALAALRDAQAPSRRAIGARDR